MTDRFGTISIEPVTSGSKPPKPSRKQRSKKKSIKQAPSRKPASLRFVLVVAFTLIFLITGYTILGYWAVPKYIASALPEKAQKHANMTLEFGQVKFDPFKFILFVDNIVLKAPNSPSPLAQLQSFQADLVPVPLLKGEIVTTQLSINKLHIDLIRDKNGKYNFSPALSAKEQLNNGEIFDFTELPFLFSLNNIAIRDSKVSFTDVPKSGSHLIENIQLTLPNLSNVSFAAKDYIRPSFSAVINGSPINLTGKAAISGNSKDIESLHTNLSVNFDNIDLPLYFDYLPIDIPFDITQGKATGNLQLSFSQASEKEKLAIEFSFQATDTLAVDKHQLSTLKVPDAKLEGMLHPFTKDIHLKTVVLREPELRSSATIPAILQLEGTSKTESADKPQSTSSRQNSVTIKSALIDNGTYLKVKGKSSKAVDSWEAIQFSLKNYTNTGSSDSSNRTRFRISAEQSDSQATISWQGKFDGQGLPAGDVHLDNISANMLFKLSGLRSIDDASGTADAKGFITIRKTPASDQPFLIYIEEGNCSLYDLELKSSKNVWYKSAVSKVNGFSRKGKQINLGNIRSLNSSVILSVDDLPLLLTDLSAPKGTLAIDTLDLSGSLTLSDNNSATVDIQFPEISVQAIHLHNNEISQDRDNLTIQAKTSKNGSIQAKGKVQISPLTAHLNTKFHNLNSLQILPWFSNHTLLNQIDAEISGKGDFSYPDVGFTGDLSLKNGSLSEYGVPYFSWQQIDFPDLLYSRTPSHLGGTTCNISSPRFDFNQNAESGHIITVLNAFFQKHTPSKHSNQERTTIVPKIEFQEINISSGTIEFEDSRLTPAWTGEITEFNGRIEKFTSRSQAVPALFSFEGLLDSIPFKLEGQNHFFNTTRKGDATISIAEYPLPSFYEQLSGVVDIDSSRGVVSVTVDTTWENEKITQQSQLTFDNVDAVSATSPSALTIALISNADRSFTLNSVTERDLNSIPSSVFSDAVAAFKKLVFKATVSPLLLATGDFKDLAGNEFAEFHPGKPELTGEGRESLARFSNLLSHHPQIGITVTGGADSHVDADALVKELEQLERKRVETENEQRKIALQQAKDAHVQNIIEARKALGESVDFFDIKIPLDIFEKYAPIQPEPVVIEEVVLTELADKRAQLIFDFLTDKLALEPERITINPASQITTAENSHGNRAIFTIGTYNTSAEPQSQVTTNQLDTIEPPAQETDEYK